MTESIKPNEEQVQKIRKELKRKSLKFSVRLPENIYNLLCYIAEKEYLTKQQIVMKSLEKPIKEWAALLYKEAENEKAAKKPILGGVF